ncbi:arginine ABC transporter substrate-binding protein [Serratia microhaemolytica]|uniref:arginine ABC transporter substrate-binding protein n=1 Tax=Serratia microhaemolytica TaxID=2675110 RepID=UPI000FDF62CD|nr:arginine ABC transporter substrate-binding protein [Serratia microhaemolytica]
MKKLFISALLVSLSLSATAETIRFATEASYPPFEFVGQDNKIQGFDIDLANALCKQLDATCTFTNQAFDSLIPSLRFKRFDAVISGMDITPERQKQVLFTQPYYDNSATFVAQKPSINDIAALAGKRVGSQNGTTHQKFLADKYPQINSVPYDSYQNALLDLKNGRIDAIFGDSAVVNEWLEQNNELFTVGNKITDKEYFGTGLGIAVRLQDKKLAERFNLALDKIKQDGTYETIHNKWFKK